MNIDEHFRFARRWLWLIGLCAVLVGAVGYIVSTIQRPIYRATSRLIVNEGDISSINQIAGLQVSEQLARSYAERLKGNYLVISRAIDELGLNIEVDTVIENMQVRFIGNTQIIEFSVEHTDRLLAQALANKIPEVFAEQNLAQQLQRFDSSKTSLQLELEETRVLLDGAEQALQVALEDPDVTSDTINTLQQNVTRYRTTYSGFLQSYEDLRIAEARNLDNIILDLPARVPTEPVRPQVPLVTGIMTFVGVIIGIGIAFLIESMDKTVRSREHLHEIFEESALGVIPEASNNSSSHFLVVADLPRSPVAEAYRHLRTNLLYTLASHDYQSVIVTSPEPGEGKTTISANLGAALAQTGKRVILVDADMRRPNLHPFFNITNDIGLSDLILDPKNGEMGLRSTEIDGLWVVTSGSVPPNPAELLGSDRMTRLVEWLSEQADFVIYDTPPLLAVTDATVLSRCIDTTLIVIQSGKSTQQNIQAAILQLQTVEANLTGFVLNRAKRSEDNYYGSYDSHYYSNGNGAQKKVDSREVNK